MNMARSLATDLGPLYADMTLGLLYKFYVSVIHPKTKYALKNHITKYESYNLTAGIMDIILAKPDDHANTKKANIMAENVVHDVLWKLKKKDKSIKLN